MSTKLNLSEKLDFSDIDLTVPDIVINELLDQLPGETNGMISGMIKSYSGHIMSYKKAGMSSIAVALGTVDKEVNIQKDLGEIGAESHKYECYLYTPEYEKYRYRMFFIEYNISNYPVTVVVEESIAKSIFGRNGGYIFTCNTRGELEELIINILTSKRVVAVMQELIRVNQAKKLEIKVEENTEADKNE